MFIGVHECSLDGPLQYLRFLFRYEIQNGGYIYVFYADRKSKMAATTIHRLTLDPMGKCSNDFFSETTNMIKAQLYMNVHWMVLYKLRFFVPI